MAQRSILKRYRLLPLIGVGLAFMIIFTALALLVWSLIAFQTKQDIAEATVLPALIYLLGVFLSAVIMTALIKGGTVFPTLVVSLVAALATLLFADAELINFGNALVKILLTLLTGIVGFTLTKLYFVGLQGRPLPQRQQRTLPDFLDDTEPASLSEPGSSAGE